MVWRILLVLIMVVAVTSVSGCKKDEPESPVGGLMKQAEETADDAKEVAEDVDVEAELDAMEAEIDAEDAEM